MAIPTRLRFEILKRDGYACRYCGATAPDVKLQVDHVRPEALGGRTEPENLVAACEECNRGKASTNPEDSLVADVLQASEDWATALELAHEEHARQRREVGVMVHAWDIEVWCQWTYTDGPLAGQVPALPGDWETTIERFLAAGLTLADLDECVRVAMKAPNVRDEFRYFCRVAWNRIDAIQERAAQITQG
jgi:hypothetical protein